MVALTICCPCPILAKSTFHVSKRKWRSSKFIGWLPAHAIDRSQKRFCWQEHQTQQRKHNGVQTDWLSASCVPCSSYQPTDPNSRRAGCNCCCWRTNPCSHSNTLQFENIVTVWHLLDAASLASSRTPKQTCPAMASRLRQWGHYGWPFIAADKAARKRRLLQWTIFPNVSWTLTQSVVKRKKNTFFSPIWTFLCRFWQPIWWRVVDSFNDIGHHQTWAQWLALLTRKRNRSRKRKRMKFGDCISVWTNHNATKNNPVCYIHLQTILVNSCMKKKYGDPIFKTMRNCWMP